MVKWALDKNSLLLVATVKPSLQKVVHRAVELSQVRFNIVSGNRTQKQQDYLFAQGRTRPGLRITWTRHSNHMGGGAVDFSLVDAKGRSTNVDPKTWKDAAKTYKPVADAMIAAGKELGTPVEWGYAMWKKDFGHIQLKDKR